MSQPRTNTEGTPTRRRNGLQPACEPCRKAKVRCDHTSTASVCSRCRKRQTLDLCIFIDAPMTGQSRAPTKSQSRARARPSNTVISTPALGTPNSRDAGLYSSSERAHGSRGFFGSTAFSATIHQASNGLKGLQDDFDDDFHPATMDCKKGAKVLKQLPSLATCERLLNLYGENSGEVGFPKVIIADMYQKLRATYGNIMEASSEDLQNIAREITKNTSTPLSQPDSADEWQASFSGPNTRWETIGFLFSSLTYGILSLGEKDVLFSGESGPKIDRKKYIVLFKECIETCIELCRDALNVLLCTLLYKNLLLETVIKGDSGQPTLTHESFGC